MKKLGFTLIEILVALGISALAMIATVQLGRQWWQRQVENQFFADFERDWAHLRQHVLMDDAHVMLVWHYEQREFTFERIDRLGEVHLQLPTEMGSDMTTTWRIDWHGGELADIKTLIFYRAYSKQKVTYTWQLGSGVLIRKDE